MSLKINQSSYTCGYCGKYDREAKVCGKCQLVRYCNPECQKQAWKTHKIVCKPPEHQQILHFKGFKLDKTIQTRLWTKGQVEETVTRPTDFISRGKEVESTPPSDSLTLGLKVNQGKLAELLRDEKYSEICDHLEAETDLALKIEWITSAATAGHVPMMMLLVNYLTQKISKGQRSQAMIEEAIKWYYLGMHCTRLDCSCNEDVSTEDGAISSFSEKGEELRQLLTIKEQKRYLPDTYKLKIISAWVPKETHPSPKWVIYHGMSVMLGINTLKPQDQWYQLRFEKHQQLLTRINKDS